MATVVEVSGNSPFAVDDKLEGVNRLATQAVASITPAYRGEIIALATGEKNYRAEGTAATDWVLVELNVSHTN
jgi:hypothetical protein|tara:strand:+ start:959 stop:1177 length:219 start_codon:yes stop_codon:yes gene_type:complete